MKRHYFYTIDPYSGIQTMLVIPDDYGGADGFGEAYEIAVREAAPKIFGWAIVEPVPPEIEQDIRDGRGPYRIAVDGSVVNTEEIHYKTTTDKPQGWHEGFTSNASDVYELPEDEDKLW